MSDADLQPMSHADRHDLDKLSRWKAGLETAGDSGAPSFPACAIFLVTVEDRASHDIFRRYRSAFEEMGGGFHHLVIFGQHGVSTTQQAFLYQAGLGEDSVPSLVIVPMAEESSTIYCIDLQKGDRDGELDDSQVWGAALHQVRLAASGDTALSLDCVEGVTSGALRCGSLSSAVNAVLQELNPES